MPTLYMMIGVPGSGKSTWLKSKGVPNANSVVLSSDHYIDQAADEAGKTYNDVFKDTIKAATATMHDDLEFGVLNELDLYWDQTNTGVKSRAKKLQKVPDHYEKVAVVFPTPDKEELAKRLDSRPGKQIPPHVMQSMISNLEMPLKDEGFDRIEVVR